jgi:L-2-hydroxyglutarate oxidase
MLLAEEGKMIDDFKIEHNGNAIHILNAPSPAATASLAIGTQVQKLADEYFHLH